MRRPRRLRLDFVHKKAYADGHLLASSAFDQIGADFTLNRVAYVERFVRQREKG